MDIVALRHNRGGGGWRRGPPPPHIHPCAFPAFRLRSPRPLVSHCDHASERCAKGTTGLHQNCRQYKVWAGELSTAPAVHLHPDGTGEGVAGRRSAVFCACLVPRKAGPGSCCLCSLCLGCFAVPPPFLVSGNRWCNPRASIWHVFHAKKNRDLWVSSGSLLTILQTAIKKRQHRLHHAHQVRD